MKASSDALIDLYCSLNVSGDDVRGLGKLCMACQPFLIFQLKGREKNVILVWGKIRKIQHSIQFLGKKIKLEL